MTKRHRSSYDDDQFLTHYLIDETTLVDRLIEDAKYDSRCSLKIGKIARKLVEAARQGRRKFGGVDAFMHEYSLTSEEGVILMCLAEALLRIPDAETADKLIADKISSGDWGKHFAASRSFFVNASTWGLMLTGRIIDLGENIGDDMSGTLKRLISHSGEPIIRQALRHAMRLMGDQFVFGETLESSLERADRYRQRGYRFSFDMLGEAACTREDADRYFGRYMKAIETAGGEGSKDPGAPFIRPDISVKNSALHARYHPSQKQAVLDELAPKLMALAEAAKAHRLGLTIDAEEAVRLSLSLELFETLLRAPELAGWNGLGLAVQAYSKRALPALKWLEKIALDTRKQIPVRLVKGAYWDSEIKFAQQEGLAGYPVFTRKSNTDISYLACARFLLARRPLFFPQFATHNAHTIASIATFARESGSETGYEFQRLHGIGEGLYEEVIGGALSLPCRLYAPIGNHKDLLSYLVRRLLENGANSSFIHRLADDQAPIDQIILNPILRVIGDEDKAHPKIPLPPALYGAERRNSQGTPHWEAQARRALNEEIKQATKTPYQAGPLIAGREERPGGLPDGEEKKTVTVLCPHDNRLKPGRYLPATEAHINGALQSAERAFTDWQACPADHRASCLEKTADLLEEQRALFLSLIIREAGKTLVNGLSEIREAVDFLRYYASQARRQFAAPQVLSGPTGEHNQMSFHGRGIFLCISPWNFPLAIFTGQIAAALAAGNAVIAKPSEQTSLIAFEMVKLFHQAGIPGDVLHLLPGTGEELGPKLLGDQRVSGVAFTGSYETARLIQKALAARPGPIIPLIAETGGLNTMIVDSSALFEQVVGDVIQSAFDSAGQRCSALRVLFLQNDIADRLVHMLCGAVETLNIGDPMEYATDIGPVIDKPAKILLEAHKEKMRHKARELIDLELPKDLQHGTYVSPGIYEIEAIDCLEREVFGPILHIVRYQSGALEEVCATINQTGYGLTLAIHSRIEPTIGFIQERMRVGNIYINRNQIGAVVGVQPFGGEGLSGTGPKAGSPQTLNAFAHQRASSINLTASGGDFSLLSLTARES